jgi:hypothetical protein
MTRITLSILAVLFGGFMIVYGGIDDSPGGQLLGLLLVIFGVYWFLKNRKKQAEKPL